MRITDRRASGVSMFCASFIRRVALGLDLERAAAPPASGSCRHPPRPRPRPAPPRRGRADAASPASAATCSRSASRSALLRRARSARCALRRSAISVSRAVNTFSSADTASARARVGLGLRLATGRATARRRRWHAPARPVPATLRRSISQLLDRRAPWRCAPPQWPARARCARARSARCAVICARSASCSRCRRARARHLGALASRAADLQLALLRQARVFQRRGRSPAPGFSVSRFLLRICDHRVLFDVVADLLAPLDLLGQARQALGVEGVGRIEELHAGLVELGQRHGLELEAVLQQVLGHRVAHALHVVAALLVHLLHRHLGGHGAQRVDELAFDQLLAAPPAAWCAGRSVWAAAAIASSSGLRRARRTRLTTSTRIRSLGDQRLVAAARDLQAQRVHVDRDDLVHDRQHEGAAVHHHLLAAEAGAHEGRAPWSERR